MKYTIELPDEAVKTIKTLGYDIKSYFDIFFVKPLLNEMKKAKINSIVARKQVEIDAELQTIKDDISIKKELSVTAETIVPNSL